MLKKEIILNKKRREQRQRRVRSKILGTSDKPRFSVFRSNKHVFAQLINDVTGSTITALNSGSLTAKEKLKKLTKTKVAYYLGLEIAKLAAQKNIKTVIFDRGHYKYHGRIKAVADGAKEGGLIF